MYLLGAAAATVAGVIFAPRWSLAAGALGGFLSVATGIRRVELDLRDDFRVIALYGALRIVIAFISAAVAFWFIRAGLLLNTLQRVPVYGELSACVIAGFSEKLIPNSLAGLSNTPRAARVAHQRLRSRDSNVDDGAEKQERDRLV